MAELDVQPKKKSPWWLWLLLALVVLALIFFLLRNNKKDREHRETDEPETGSVTAPPTHSFAYHPVTIQLAAFRTT